MLEKKLCYEIFYTIRLFCNQWKKRKIGSDVFYLCLAFKSFGWRLGKEEERVFSFCFLPLLTGRDGRDGRDGRKGFPGARGFAGPKGMKIFLREAEG